MKLFIYLMVAVAAFATALPASAQRKFQQHLIIVDRAFGNPNIRANFKFETDLKVETSASQKLTDQPWWTYREDFPESKFARLDSFSVTFPDIPNCTLSNVPVVGHSIKIIVTNKGCHISTVR
ncbi:MAG: hypothetical protein K0U23_04160 [Gammaproteobacteria bacterium]|nr:hypothetical protein [Gammaproteobacteria bacterium]